MNNTKFQKQTGYVMAICLAFLLLAWAFPGRSEAAVITVKVDGVAVVFPDQQPFADSNSRVQVPIRFPMEMMGVEAQWVQSKHQAVLTKGSTTAIFTIGSKSYTVNGVNKTMDTVPLAMNNRTLFPIRFAAEAFGATATWDGPNNTALISTGSTPPENEAPQPTIYEYPQDASHLDGYTLIRFTPGLEGNGIKVKCTNDDTINVRPLRDINNNIIGTTRDDDRWMSYWDLAATALYGTDGTYQVPVGTTLTLDVWIMWYDNDLMEHEALVLDEFQFTVPDHPKN